MEEYPSLAEGTGLENQQAGDRAGVRIPLPPPFFKRSDVTKPSELSTLFIAGWSSLVARKAHNLEVVGSNPSPATNGPVV